MLQEPTNLNVNFSVQDAVVYIDYTKRNNDLYLSDFYGKTSLVFINMPANPTTFNLPSDSILVNLFNNPQLGSNNSWSIDIGGTAQLTLVSQNSTVLFTDQGVNTLIMEVTDPVTPIINLQTGSGGGGGGGLGPTGPTGAIGPTGYIGLLNITGYYWGDYLYWNGATWQIGSTNISLGRGAGSGQSTYAVALGYQAGWFDQASSIAIGYQSGFRLQGDNALSMGYQCGYNAQSTNSVAVGYQSGYNDQNNNSVAIGFQSGYNIQNNSSVAVGYQAGYDNQQLRAVAVGYRAGMTNQSRALLHLSAR